LSADKMSGGAPIPVTTTEKDADPEGKVLCIADLEREGSKKLPRVVRGETVFCTILDASYWMRTASARALDSGFRASDPGM
jgi:hypothetical protein